MPDEIDELLNDMRSENEKPCVDAAFKLAEMRDRKAVPGLVSLLKHSHPLVRNFAVFALAEIGDEAAEEPVRELLQDVDLGVRVRAGWALSKIGTDRSIPALANALKEALDDDAHLSRQIMLALSQIGRSTVDEIAPALHSSIPEVRETAVHFLNYIGNPKAKSHLLQLMEHETNGAVLEELRQALVDLDAISQRNPGDAAQSGN
jgi:HEAT repeat protein